MAKQFVCNPDYPVVETANGKLRGFQLDGIFTFYGIDYGKARRFHMPEPADKWEGIKEATDYGYVCPNMLDVVPGGEMIMPHRYWPESEHCLNLNVWTPSIDRAARKPVLVWFHGGGYFNGSALEQVAYEGDALAKWGDVVVVTVNHRLNILGFLDLSDYGEEYHNSANAGIADLVQSLKWVRENIAAFGGDPDNVTIFGQSGGGGKVCTLLQTPEADGLFHKAVLMSGGAGLWGKEGNNNMKEFVDEMMNILELKDIHELEEVPYRPLEMACKLACEKLNRHIWWAPKANDWYLGHPTAVGFTEHAKTVPTMVSSVISEFVPQRGPVDPKEYFKEDAEAAVKAFKAAYPENDACWAYSASDRGGIVKFMNLRAESGATSPAYCYVLGLVFDIYGGLPAWHCADIPYVFHNADRVAYCNVEGVCDRIEAEMAGALVAFAKNGDPNHEALAKWKPWTKDCHATMVFNRESACREDFDDEFMEYVRKYGEPRLPRVPEKKAKEPLGRIWLYR